MSALPTNSYVSTDYTHVSNLQKLKKLQNKTKTITVNKRAIHQIKKRVTCLKLMRIKTCNDSENKRWLKATNLRKQKALAKQLKTETELMIERTEKERAFA